MHKITIDMVKLRTKIACKVKMARKNKCTKLTQDVDY